jgi:hypothetical protein
MITNMFYRCSASEALDRLTSRSTKQVAKKIKESQGCSPSKSPSVQLFGVVTPLASREERFETTGIYNVLDCEAERFPVIAWDLCGGDEPILSCNREKRPSSTKKRSLVDKNNIPNNLKDNKRPSKMKRCNAFSSSLSELATDKNVRATCVTPDTAPRQLSFPDSAQTNQELFLWSFECPYIADDDTVS